MDEPLPQRPAPASSDLQTIQRAIEAMGSDLATHGPVIEVFLEEAPRWSRELAGFAVPGVLTTGDASARLLACLHEVANGMAIAGAAADAARVRGLEHQLGCSPSAGNHREPDLAWVAGEARFALALAVEALRAVLTSLRAS